MGTGRWRIAVAILGGTGWGWMVVLPRIREIADNPGIVPSWHLPALLAVCLVLLVIDVGALWYWLGGSDADSPDAEERGAEGRPADDDAGRRSHRYP